MPCPLGDRGLGSAPPLLIPYRANCSGEAKMSPRIGGVFPGNPHEAGRVVGVTP